MSSTLRDPLFGVGPSSTTLTNTIQQQTLFNVNNLKQNRTEKQCYLQINTEREREKERERERGPEGEVG